MLRCVAVRQGAARPDGDPGRRRDRGTALNTLANRLPRPFPKPTTRETEAVETSPFVNSVVEAASAFSETEDDRHTPLDPNEHTSAALERLRNEIGNAKWSRAAKTAHRVLTQGEAMDTVLLDRLLQGLCHRGSFRQAIQLYDRIADQDRSLQYRTCHLLIQSALKAQLSSFGQARMGCLLQDGAYTFALKLYKDMESSGYSLNEVTYCMILTGLHQDRRKGSRSHTAAYEIWDEIKNSNCNIDAALFRAGCGACVAVGRVEEAMSLIPIMRQKGYRPDSRFYNILIQGHCRLRDMKSAFKCFEEMQAAGILPTRTTFNTLLQGFVLGDDMKNAERTLKYSISEGCRPDVWTYTSLMKGYLSSNAFDDVIRLSEEFQSQGGQPNEVTYGVLVDAYVQNGRLDLAHAQLDVMIQCGLQPNTVIYNTLLKGYSSGGSKSDILKLLAEMKQRGVYPEVDTLNTLLAKMLEMGSTGSNVSALFDEMMKLGFQPDAVSYTYLLRAAHREGNIAKCRQIFNQMESNAALELDGACWNLMVSVLAQSSDMSGAEEMLQGAVDYAEDRHLPIPVEAFGAIIQGYVSEQDLTAAIAKFRWFCKLGGRPDGPMLEQLLELCIIKHDMHHALKILRATGLLDKQIDLTKHREMLRRIEQDTEVWNAVQTKQKSAGFERLKFWLGMPNSYYTSDWP